MNRIAWLVAAFGLLTPALAGDGEAKALLKEAQAAWSEPEKALETIDRALEEGPTGGLADQCKLFRACILHELGEFDDAEASYSALIRKLGGSEERLARVIRGEAMARKARILFSHRGDTRAAVQLLVSSLEANPNPSTADMASVLYLRLAQNSDEFDATQRAKWLGLATQFNRDSLTYNAQLKARKPDAHLKNKAKFEVQSALIQFASGDEAAAKATFNAIPEADLSPATFYQQGVYKVLVGDTTAALELMKGFLKTRTTPGARNLARRFARTEPSLAEQIKTPEWAELFGSDEKVRRRRSRK